MPNEEVRRFQCQHCVYIAKRKGHLKTHMKSQHPEASGDPLPAPVAPPAPPNSPAAPVAPLLPIPAQVAPQVTEEPQPQQELIELTPELLEYLQQGAMVASKASSGGFCGSSVLPIVAAGLGGYVLGRTVGQMANGGIDFNGAFQMGKKFLAQLQSGGEGPQLVVAPDYNPQTPQTPQVPMSPGIQAAINVPPPVVEQSSNMSGETPEPQPLQSSDTQPSCLSTSD